MLGYIYSSPERVVAGADSRRSGSSPEWIVAGVPETITHRRIT
jgi:hypothetical protein